MEVDEIVAKQSGVITCRPEDTVQTAAVLLHSNRIGVMPVVDAEGAVVGIFGERDIVRAFASREPGVSGLLVGDLMTTAVVSCSPGTSLAKAMDLMKQNRIRHVPVIDDGKLCGIISIRDALEELRRLAELEANVMRDLSIAARKR